MSKLSNILESLRRIQTDESVGEPEEGWCLVMANGKVTSRIYLDKSDAIAQQKKAPVSTKIKWGKRASDGSNEYIATRAIDPTEAYNDSVDTITLDIPLLMRLLEYSREEIKSDAELHEFVTNIIEVSKSSDILDMNIYDKLVIRSNTDEIRESSDYKEIYNKIKS